MKPVKPQPPAPRLHSYEWYHEVLELLRKPGARERKPMPKDAGFYLEYERVIPTFECSSSFHPLSIVHLSWFPEREPLFYITNPSCCDPQYRIHFGGKFSEKTFDAIADAIDAGFFNLETSRESLEEFARVHGGYLEDPYNRT